MNPFENLQPNNVGNAFMGAYQQGAQQRREGETRNALMKYAANPKDPEAMSELSKWDPKTAIQLREHQQTMALKQLDAHKDQIQIGAAILSANPPRDQATWDAVKTEAARYGIDVSQLPATWDAQAQQYVQGVIAADKHLNPGKEQGTTLERNYQFLHQQNPQLAEQYLRNEAEGSPLIASNGDGTFTIVPRSQAGQMQQGGPQPGVVEDGYRFKGGNPADPNSWEQVNGGPTPQASGGFPSSGY